MTVIDRLHVDPEQLRNLCVRWGIAELWAFGSALRDDFTDGSDVDLLLTFLPQVHPSLHEWVEMEDQFAALFGRPVDLVERQAVEDSPNYIRRRSILTNLECLHGA
jgi:hypothetical protein